MLLVCYLSSFFGTFPFMLAQALLVGSKTKQDCGPIPGRKSKMGGGSQKAFMSPAVIPFMFSLTQGLESSQEVGTNPREGCDSGLRPLPALCSVVGAGVTLLFQQPPRLSW